jgi:SAM-dependent methyltransferase
MRERRIVDQFIDDKYLTRSEKITRDPAEIRLRHESNRKSWNEGAQHGYTPQIDQVIEFIRSGKSNLHPVERTYLAELLPTCELAIHLQCASGRDTLSLLNEGVKRVVGVDISDVHIENARRISSALNAPAQWHRCDILDAPAVLDGAADLVYTGRGALNWLQDLDAWAKVVARLLKPGGAVSIFDGHPLTWLFKMEAAIYEYSGVNYFAHCESGAGWPDTYIGDIGIPNEQQARKYECLWPVSSVFQALTRAGLDVVHFGEHPEPYWDEFPNLKSELRGRIPNTFSMLAKKV